MLLYVHFNALMAVHLDVHVNPPLIYISMFIWINILDVYFDTNVDAHLDMHWNMY